LHTLVVERLSNRFLISFIIGLFSAGVFSGHARLFYCQANRENLALTDGRVSAKSLGCLNGLTGSYGFTLNGIRVFKENLPLKNKGHENID
jgi:hypothetical protein